MRKISLFLILVVSGLCLFGLVQSMRATTTIVTYPELDGAVVPGQATAGEELPQLIKYIFSFALGAAGILGLLMIIFGGFRYLTSTGNPQQASEGKNQIVSALLGILLLLGSYLLLNIINPDLLKLGIAIEPVDNTIHFWDCYCCNGEICEPHMKVASCLKGTKTRADSACSMDCYASLQTDSFNYKSEPVSECKSESNKDFYACYICSDSNPGCDPLANQDNYKFCDQGKETTVNVECNKFNNATCLPGVSTNYCQFSTVKVKDCPIEKRPH